MKNIVSKTLVFVIYVTREISRFEQVSQRKMVFSSGHSPSRRKRDDVSLNYLTIFLATGVFDEVLIAVKENTYT